MRTLTGVAVITGGASGIGAACAQVFAAAGAAVIVLDRDIARARAVADAVRGHAVAGDVGDAEGIDRIAGEIVAAHGPVAALVNSAGVIQKPLRPEALSMADWDEVVRIDQRGTYVCCRAFGGHMVRASGGAIVNIASITGNRSVPLHAYAPAKAAVIAMTENLAAEWGPAGVRVNVISPGYTRTPALQAAIDRGERDVGLLKQHSALRRMVEPDEIGRVAAFLCSADAAAITGANLPVDCGWLVSTSWVTYGGLREPAIPTEDAR